MRRPHWETEHKRITEVVQLIGTPDPKLDALQLMDQVAAEYGRLLAVPSGMVDEFALMVAFQATGAHIYKIGREFGHVLDAVDCRIDPSFIRFENTTLCIEIPDDMEFDLKDGDRAVCSYVGLLNHPQRGRAVFFSTPCRSTEGEWTDITDKLVLPIDEPELAGKNIEDMVDYATSRTTRPTGYTKEYVKYLFKCILYIQSGEPDLTLWKPARKPSNAKNLKKWRRLNPCSIPLINVGFNYKKPVVYSKSETAVTGHWRWQPYGPERDRVKLIWIKDHIRHFKTEEIL